MTDPAAYTLAQQQQTTDTDTLVRQLAQLRALAAQGQGYYTQNLSGAGVDASNALNAGIGGLTSDLAAQGASSPNVGGQLLNTQAELAATEQRQRDYINALAGAQSTGLDNAQRAAYDAAAAAGNSLASNYAQSIAADSGGGGGYGGYDGYGGGHGYGSYNDDQLTAGDAALVAELAEGNPRNDPYYDVTKNADAVGWGNKYADRLLGAFLHGDQGLGLGHVSGGGAHAAQLANKYIRAYAAHVNTKTKQGQKNLQRFKQSIKEERNAVKSNAGKRATAIKKRRETKNKAKGRRLID